MGRLDESGKHEGYVVGYVPRAWVPTINAVDHRSSRPVAVLERYNSSGVLRQLGLLDADEAHEIYGICVVGYACSCGWRSPYYELSAPVEWSPSSVDAPEWLDDLLAKKWWRPHVIAEEHESSAP